MSVNGGRNFTNMAVDALYTSARYAAFPTEDVWYIAAGEWPSTSEIKNTNDGLLGLPRNLVPRRSVYQDGAGRFPRSYTPQNLGDGLGGIGYKAQIVRVSAVTVMGLELDSDGLFSISFFLSP